MDFDVWPQKKRCKALLEHVGTKGLAEGAPGASPIDGYRSCPMNMIGRTGSNLRSSDRPRDRCAINRQDVRGIRRHFSDAGLSRIRRIRVDAPRAPFGVAGRPERGIMVAAWGSMR
jgi:hypothetical protein